MAGNRRFLVGPSVLLEVESTLSGLVFPASVNSGRVPTVYFVSDNDERDEERIELEAQISDGAVEWQSTGALQSETLDIAVRIYAGEPGQTGTEALTRANELAQVVQEGFRNQTTGRPTGIATAGVIGNYRVRSYSFEAFPVMDDGWGAMFELVLRVETRL